MYHGAGCCCAERLVRMRSDSSSKLAKVTGLGDFDGVAVVSELGETEKDSSRRQIAFVFPVFNSRYMLVS